MVPDAGEGRKIARDSPRIRGDGPMSLARQRSDKSFSPYSRGWSQAGRPREDHIIILPVFAGMVPIDELISKKQADSPRIRGDGPRL